MESVMHLFGPFFYVTGIAWAAATAGFATLWLRARARAETAERRLAENGIAAPGAAIAGGELRQVHAALDAIAAEVERIGEGQRFTTDLLARRQSVNGAPSPARADDDAQQLRQTERPR